jgi:hypothetical protein
VPVTNAEGLARAHRTLQGDWDAAGTATVYLPAATASSLLETRGWTVHPDGSWDAPTGERVWHASDALQLALIAEAGSAAPLPEPDGPGLRRTADQQLIDRELLDDLITTVLEHDALLDVVDDVLFDHVATARHTRAEVAAALPGLIADTLAAADPDDWQRYADQLIADVRDIHTATTDIDHTNNPREDPPR